MSMQTVTKVRSKTVNSKHKQVHSTSYSVYPYEIWINIIVSQFGNFILLY